MVKFVVWANLVPLHITDPIFRLPVRACETWISPDTCRFANHICEWVALNLEIVLIVRVINAAVDAVFDR
jgi:hypothetical protein